MLYLSIKNVTHTQYWQNLQTFFPFAFPFWYKNKQKTHKLAAICKYLINTVGEGSKNNYFRLCFATPQLSSSVAMLNDKPL